MGKFEGKIALVTVEQVDWSCYSTKICKRRCICLYYGT